MEQSDTVRKAIEDHILCVSNRLGMAGGLLLRGGVELLLAELGKQGAAGDEQSKVVDGYMGGQSSISRAVFLGVYFTAAEFERRLRLSESKTPAPPPSTLAPCTYSPRLPAPKVATETTAMCTHALLLWAKICCFVSTHDA